MTVGNNTSCACHVYYGATTLNQCPYMCPAYMTLIWYIQIQICMYFYICTSTYRYIHVCTSIYRYKLNTLFLYYNWSRFQMVSSIAIFSATIICSGMIACNCRHPNCVRIVGGSSSRNFVSHRDSSRNSRKQLTSWSNMIWWILVRGPGPSREGTGHRHWDLHYW